MARLTYWQEVRLRTGTGIKYQRLARELEGEAIELREAGLRAEANKVLSLAAALNRVGKALCQ